VLVDVLIKTERCS